MRRFAIVLIVAGIPMISVAQGKKGAAAAAAAPAAAPAAPASGAQQAGFVYFLKFKQHLHYAALRTEVHFYTKAMLAASGTDQIFGVAIDPKKPINATIILDRKPAKALKNGYASFPEYDIRSIMAPQGTIPAATPSLATDTLLTVTIQYYDSLARFWDRRRSSVFTRSRLKVAITQDTAILQTKTIYPDFSDNPTVHFHKISNPNFRPGIIVTPSANGPQPAVSVIQQQQQSFVQNLGTGKFPMSTRAMDLPSLFQEKVVSEKVNLSPEDAYVSDEGDYEGHLRLYAADQFAAYKVNYSDGVANQQVIDDYNRLSKGYFKLIRQYHSLTQALRTDLDGTRSKMYDPAQAADTVENQLAFFEGLYELFSGKLKAPPPLPPNLIDPKIGELAVNISTYDSANNLYLRIIHKALVSRSLYFIKLHYSTWDYGSITVPFRYRPMPPDRHIISQSGKPNTTVAATSESDAALNVSLYFGRKWGHTRFYEDPTMTSDRVSIEPVAIMGPTLIPMSLSNVDSSSRFANITSQYAYTGPANIIAWSFGAGVVLQYKSINLGMFVGTDCPLTAKTGWVYADRPWFGFGIGVNLGMLAAGTPL